jgi:2-polyprenyl-6-methoxyphenol hydroxylase-like FAD-dependent oxidoreductase
MRQAQQDGQVDLVMLIEGGRNWYVRRVDAWKIFYEHVVTSGVEIIFGKFVIGAKEQPTAVLFADGSSMEADIVIGADGRRPKLSGPKMLTISRDPLTGPSRTFS